MAPYGSNGYNPVCVVAGTGPGLGLAIAERYAVEGFITYLLFRRPSRLAPAVATLRARGLSIVSMSCDVSKIASIEAAIRDIRTRAGRCDVLVYDASRAENSEFHTNSGGALAFIHEIVEEMRGRRNGALVFSCRMGCKADLHAVVDGLAEETKQDGIRVGLVTIHGTMPRLAAELKNLAELYWQMFVASEAASKRELCFRGAGSARLKD